MNDSRGVLPNTFSFSGKKLDVKEYILKAENIVAIVLHGSGSNGTWYEDFKEFVDDKSLGIHIKPVSYGPIFPPCVLFRARNKDVIDEVAAQLKEIILSHSSEDQISIIAHSYGTYLIANWLDQHTTKFRFIFLMGGICKQSNLKSIEDKADRIYNDVAVKDYVPLIAHAFRPDSYQATGTYGLRNVTKIIDRFF